MDHIMLLKVPIEFDFHGLKRASLYPQPFSFNFHLKGKKVATVLRFEPRLMRGPFNPIKGTQSSKNHAKPP